MNVSRTINCTGLSAAPTVLRIKQALLRLSDGTSPLGVLVDADCDHKRLASSLGKRATNVRFVPQAKRTPVYDGPVRATV